MKDINNTYSYKEAKALVESMIDQDTKFNREVEALIDTQEAKDVLLKAYNDTDDTGKQAIAQATEEQFLDKFAPAGKDDEDKDNKDDDKNEDDDFIEDGSIFDNDGSEDDESGEEDSNIDDSLFDDGSEDENVDNEGDNQDNGNSNSFADATSGDDGSKTATPDTSSNPFFESRKPKHEHHLNEARKNARMKKSGKINDILNENTETFEAEDYEYADDFDNDWCQDVYKFLDLKIKKFPTKREKYLYLKKIQKEGPTTESVIKKFIVKYNVDTSAYGKNYMNIMKTVFATLAGDILDLEF